MTPQRFSDVPETLFDHDIPSEEIRMVPPSPTVTMVLFPIVTSFRTVDVPDVLEVQEVPSDEVRMVPPLPTVTKVLFP